MNTTEMLDHIDAKAGAARACYITIAPGQETTYLLKAQQAGAFALAGFAGPVPGMVAAEMLATGLDAQTASERILEQEAAWTQIAAGIEGIRRAGKVAVKSATEDAARAAACEQAIDRLTEWMP